MKRKKNRQQVFCLLSFILLSTWAGQAQRIKGSDTVLPLSQKEAEAYLTKKPNANIVVTGGGSGVGIAALLEGTADIAQSSRRIKFDEQLKLKNKGKEVVELIVAYDALAVITHPSNPVDKLSREELEGIFRGKIKNWKELGGPDLKIIPYARETSSGTYEFFKERVLNYKNYQNGIISMPATGSVIQSISQTPGAIGYVGLAYLNPSVRAVQISYDQGKTFSEPQTTQTAELVYPITRPLYYYFLQEAAPQLKSFLEFIQSEEGRRLIVKLGFIPAN